MLVTRRWNLAATMVSFTVFVSSIPINAKGIPIKDAMDPQYDKKSPQFINANCVWVADNCMGLTAAKCELFEEPGAARFYAGTRSVEGIKAQILPSVCLCC